MGFWISNFQFQMILTSTMLGLDPILARQPQSRLICGRFLARGGPRIARIGGSHSGPAECIATLPCPRTHINPSFDFP